MHHHGHVPLSRGTRVSRAVVLAGGGLRRQGVRKVIDVHAPPRCVFLVDPASGEHAPRLPVLGDGRDIPLTEAMLKDGPWCPDATARDRFDAG